MVWLLAFALLFLPGAGSVTASAAEQEKTSKEKLDEAKKDLNKGVQEISKPIQKVMKPVEKAISEGSSKAASTVKKAVTSDTSDKK